MEVQRSLETYSMFAVGSLCGFDVGADAAWSGFVALGVMMVWFSYFAFRRVIWFWD